MDNSIKTELKELYLQHKLVGLPYSEIIDWAINQLENDVSEDILILSGLYAYEVEDINICIRNVLGKEFYISMNELEEIAGKLIVEHGNLYLNKKLDLVQLEVLIDKLSHNLDYPDWIVVLSRNAEYSSDIEFFIKPFMDELEYIIGLWQAYPKYNDFQLHYNRNESNKRL